MKGLRMIIGGIITAFLISSPLLTASAANWTLGDVDAPSHWGPTSAKQLSDSVSKATSGDLKITVYPTESLFKGKDSLDAVSKNLTQMYRVMGFHVAGEAQIFELLDLPLFVPWDYDFRVKLWDTLTPMYRDYLHKNYQIYLAGILQAEPRMIYTKESFNNLKDLNGRKIRSAGPVESEFTNKIGMVALSIAPSEIYTALQQGLIDGNWVADAPHFYNKGYEVTKYIYDVGSAGAGTFVLVNEEALSDLSDKDRKALMDAFPSYIEALRAGTKNGAANGREWLIKEGMSVVPVSDADRKTMQVAADKIVEEWQKRLDPEAHKIYLKAKEMIDAYYKAKP